jgi:hypothetical protein
MACHVVIERYVADLSARLTGPRRWRAAVLDEVRDSLLVTWNHAAGRSGLDRNGRVIDLDLAAPESGHTGGFHLPSSSSLLLEGRPISPLIRDHLSPAMAEADDRDKPDSTESWR